MITLTLPWPDKRLSPNARICRQAKANAVSEARSTATVLTLEAGYYTAPEGAKLTLKFYPPDNRRHDLDNLIARMKPYLDGIFDALDCNDHEILDIHASRESKLKGGAVELTLEAA